MRHLHPFLIGIAVALGGCASPERHAIFMTKTSLAVIDAETAPAGISIAYDRTEAYAGPRFSDGQVAPVAGSFETDGSIFSRRLRQVYATGHAALTVNTPTGQPLPQKPEVKPNQDPTSHVMTFGTSTTIGLKIGFSQGTVVPDSFTLGYKRKEMSIIPVDKGIFPSVIGTLDNTVEASIQKDKKGDTGFGVSQYFATGDAADAVAALPGVRQSFASRARQALDPQQAYRNEEALQGREALDLLACFSRLNDESLQRVWNNAEDLGLFESASMPEELAVIRSATPTGKQRQLYIGDISQLNADSPAHTQKLRAHKEAVCRLARN